MTQRSWLSVALATAAVSAACSGGGSTPPKAALSGAGSSAPLTSNVTFTVDVPKGVPPSSHLRRRSGTVYISPNTQSISIQLGAVDGVSLHQPPPPSVANVPAPCVGSSNGCSVVMQHVPAAVGDDAFVVTTFNLRDARGAVISQGIVPVTVASGGGSGTIGGTTLSLGGFVQSIGLTMTPTRFLRGVAQDATLIVVPKDAAGAVIVGNTQFAYPIAIVASPSPQLQVTGLPFSGGVAMLTQPESASGPIHIHYDGSPNASVGQVTARSIDSGGAPIQAVVAVTVGAPTPPPPTPTPTGQTPPPQDLYLLNGEDNTVVDVANAANPNPSASPRRIFGGIGSLGCKPRLKGLGSLLGAPLGASGIALDGSGNTIVGNGSACPGGETFYQFAPAASGPSSPSAVFATTQSVAGNYLGFALDATRGFIDVSDGSQSAYLLEWLPAGKAATLVAAFGALGLSSQGTCILTPGVAACTNPPAAGTFVSAPLGADVFDQFSQVFALDGNAANYYYPAKDSSLANVAIVAVPANQAIPVNDPLANPAWIEGIDTFTQSYVGPDADRVSNYPVGLAVDGHLLFVLNAPFTGLAFGQGGKRLTDYYAPAAACNPNANATPSPGSMCKDGTPHEYLTAYDLSQLTASGPNALEPVLVVGGDSFPGGAAAGGSFANRLSVGAGRVFVVDPAGQSCDPKCFAAIGSLGKKPVGQIAVYAESLTGVHINDAASVPSTVLGGPNVKFPTGAAVGAAPP